MLDYYQLIGLDVDSLYKILEQIYDDFLVGADSVFQTIPFMDVYFPHKIQKLSVGNLVWVLQVFAPNVAKNQQLAMVGRGSLLGDWTLKNNLIGKYIGKGWWAIVLDSEFFGRELEYKFVLVDKKTKIIAKWEDGENRINVFSSDEKTHILNLRFRQNYDFHAVGTAVPVFSLRGEKGWGVGEFLDIKNLVDWASKREMKVIQLLPINDTTRTKTDSDSYPYSANSIYALNPLYLNCPKVGILNDKSAQKQFLKRAENLNKKSFVLEKYHNPIKDEELVFDFSKCEGTIEESILALVSVEKIFRIYKTPTAKGVVITNEKGDVVIQGDGIKVDRKIDLFLKKTFNRYDYYCSGLVDMNEINYVYYTGVNEDPQADDLTLLAVKKN